MLRGDALPSRPVNLPGRAALQNTSGAALLVLGMASLAGVVRVLPWLAAANVPWRVAVPFARALLAVAMETALLCAPPMGWALAAAKLVERGEARALFANGISPVDIVRRTAPHAAACALMAGAAALAWGTEAAAPGRLVRAIVQEAKHGCENATSPRALHVPLVGATWLCAAPSPARIFGALPANAGHFSARDLSVSDDLRAVELTDSQILLAAPEVRLHVAETHVRGVAPMGRASAMQPWVRSVLVATTGACLALAAAWLVLQRANGSRAVALLLGAAGPFAALSMLTHLEAREHRAAIYAAVPLAAVAGLVAANVLVRLFTPLARRA
jgi:hypothetical protein